MNIYKKRISLLLVGVVLAGVVALTGCASPQKSQEGKESLTVAYQYGLAYAPLTIMQELQLIESNYDGEIEIEWLNLNSGSAINEGVLTGEIDVANMGVGPFVTGVTAGIPYKMYATISAQPHKLMSNNPDIQSLEDIKPEHKIALVNIGSIQHILLSMQAEKELADAHALDENIVAMSHPDGMVALLSGSVDCQLTTAPYIYEEMESEGIHEIAGLEEVWPEGSAFIVGLVSDDLYENRPELYDAVVAATQEAIVYMNENPEHAAEIVASKQDYKKEDVLKWITSEGCVYDSHLDGVMRMADFMAQHGFVEKAPDGIEAITTPSAR
nr:ABC transporter substrate-binding protein [Lachnospiraceae bacterium]